MSTLHPHHHPVFITVPFCQRMIRIGSQLTFASFYLDQNCDGQIFVIDTRHLTRDDPHKHHVNTPHSDRWECDSVPVIVLTLSEQSQVTKTWPSSTHLLIWFLFREQYEINFDSEEVINLNFHFLKNTAGNRISDLKQFNQNKTVLRVLVFH